MRSVLLICALIVLSCTYAYAQPQGWSMSYAEKSVTIDKSPGGSGVGYSTSSNGSYCSAALYGGSNSFAEITIVTTATLSRTPPASATVEFRAKSRIQGNLSSSQSGAAAVFGDQFPSNLDAWNAVGIYDITKYGQGNSRDQPATFEFTCKAGISGNYYGSTSAQGKYEFL